MGKLAEAQSCARRYADVDCEEIPRDARGDCVGKQSGEGRSAERGRQADYSGGATRERNEEPAGAIPRTQGDTLLGIADRYSVSSADLRKSNHSKTAQASRRMVLR